MDTLNSFSWQPLAWRDFERSCGLKTRRAASIGAATGSKLNLRSRVLRNQWCPSSFM